MVSSSAFQDASPSGGSKSQRASQSPRLSLLLNSWEPRTVWAILEHATRDYIAAIASVTLPLVGPIIAILVGVVLALVLPGPVVLHYLFPVTDNKLLLIIAVLLALVPGLGILFWGFWRYFIYYVSLNGSMILWKHRGHLEYVDVVRDCRAVEHDRGMAYGNVLLLIIGAWVPLLLALPVFTLGLAAAPAMLALWVGIALAVAVVGTLLGCAVAVASILIFQVSAFETIGLNPLPVLFRSANLVFPNVHRIIVVWGVVFLITGVIAPLVVGLVGDLLGVHYAASLLWEPLLQVLLQDMPDSGIIGELIAVFKSLDKGLAYEVAKGVNVSVVGQLFLPWSTWCMLYMYADILKRNGEPWPAGPDGFQEHAAA